MVDRAFEAALERRTGPTFVDFPLDHVFMEGPPSDAPVDRRTRATRRPPKGWKRRSSC